MMGTQTLAKPPWPDVPTANFLWYWVSQKSFLYSFLAFSFL